ncbi:hydroxymethylpyrimidine ABC transporter substrate-binding protein [Klebsiella pneumoniae]|nr:hydroxymethylpyrimidine ABC transporter substrate-binding protein [Klebsiella pneumoniae]
MKTGARLPRGIRWLGLMALGGVSLAVQAEEKIVLLTSWYAQAEQGVIIRLRPPGCTKNMVSTSRSAPVDRRSTACSCCCRSGPM